MHSGMILCMGIIYSVGCHNLIAKPHVENIMNIISKFERCCLKSGSTGPLENMLYVG